MKTAGRYFFTTVVLTLVAGVILAAGLLQTDIATGERELATLNLNRAATVFDRVQDRLSYTNSLDWLVGQMRDEVEARQVAVRYWRGEYATLLSQYPDLGQPGIRANVPLQLILASAYVRAGEATADGDSQLMLGELDRAISIYLQVLQHTSGDRDAAFNYEYLVRLRAEIAAGGDVTPRRPPSLLGRPGNDEDMDMDDEGETKVYVPADRFLEREASDEPTLGTDAPIRRRG